jgi:hypothetical protein
MSNIWHGADPAGVADAGDYELGTVIEALENISLTGIRVWSPANAVDRPDRKGHVWSIAGALLATVDMPQALTSGWTTHTLAAPIAMDAGDFAVVSYESNGNYGFIAAALGTDSHVALDQAAAFPQSQAVLVAGSSTTGNGRFAQPPGTVPNSSNNHAFYGVDAVYDVTGAGTAPTVTGLTLTSDDLTVTAAVAASDPDGLVGATYSADWGDGQTSSGASATLNHTYAAGGLKVVMATVTDSTALHASMAGAITIASENAPTILQIMRGIEARLATIDGLRVSDTAPGEISPPAAFCAIPPVDNYHKTFQRGRFGLSPQIWVFTSAAVDRVGQEALAAYANPTGDKSIIAAIYGDKTLGGVVEDIIVRSFRPLGMEEVGLIGYFGGVFETEIIALGS